MCPSLGPSNPLNISQKKSLVPCNHTSGTSPVRTYGTMGLSGASSAPPGLWCGRDPFQLNSQLTTSPFLLLTFFPSEISKSASHPRTLLNAHTPNHSQNPILPHTHTPTSRLSRGLGSPFTLKSRTHGVLSLLCVVSRG